MNYSGGWLLLLPRGLAALYRRARMQVATLLMRLVLPQVGRGTRFRSLTWFAQPSIVRIGNDCYFWEKVACGADYPGASLLIGNRVQINRGVHLDTTGGLEIGDDVLISEETVVYTHDHGLDPHSAPVGVPKTIARGAWIGMRVIILPGCRYVGENSVIGAGSVVTRDVEPGTIVAGNPARAIGRRTAQ